MAPASARTDNFIDLSIVSRLGRKNPRIGGDLGRPVITLIFRRTYERQIMFSAGMLKARPSGLNSPHHPRETGGA